MTYPHPYPTFPRDERGIPHEASFRVCLHDLEVLLEYVELHTNNLATYSYRSYELLLRVSTEFEATCKSLLPSPAPHSNIKDYEALSSQLDLPAYSVGFMTGSPNPIILTPFKEWSVPGTSLSWYQSYNRVKHNRSSAFHEANLQNLLSAFAGLFVLLAHGFKPELFFPSNSQFESPGHLRAYYEQFPLFIERAA